MTTQSALLLTSALVMPQLMFAASTAKLKFWAFHLSHGPAESFQLKVKAIVTSRLKESVENTTAIMLSS